MACDEYFQVKRKDQAEIGCQGIQVANDLL
jgi:hypothetical protein